MMVNMSEDEKMINRAYSARFDPDTASVRIAHRASRMIEHMSPDEARDFAEQVLNACEMAGEKEV